HHRRPGEVVLHEREEHLTRDIVAHARVLRVLHHADDLDRRLRAWIDAEAYVTTERAAVLEVVPRVALVDDRHLVRRRTVCAGRRLVSRVAIVEVAPGHERDAHRLEVTRADGVAIRVHVLARLRLVTFDRD